MPYHCSLIAFLFPCSNIKKAREIELCSSLRSSTFSQMHNEDGYIVSASNNNGEQDSWYPEMDTSAAGMRLKVQREMAAMKRGEVVTNHKETTTPRELSQDEKSSLHVLLKSKINVSNDSHEQDADNLIEYTIEMVGDGKTVGYITDEVSFRSHISCIIVFIYNSPLIDLVHYIQPRNSKLTKATLHGNGGVYS